MEDDFFEDPKSAQVIRKLRILVKEGPVNMRAFTFHAEMAPRHSEALRHRLVELGLVQVDSQSIRGARNLEIKVTKEGEELLKTLSAPRAVVERARRKAKKNAEDAKE
jgi:hypothetical protein